MTKFTQEARELSIGELDVVSGGDMLGMAIDAAEKVYERFIWPFDQRRAPAGDDAAQMSLHANEPMIARQ